MVASAGAIAVLLAGVVTWRLVQPAPTRSDRCSVVGITTGERYAMSPEQLLNASIITDVALRRGLPERAVVIALAVAQQESKLQNLSYGDADSVGLFQQRPSQGWGERSTLLVPQTAATKFFDALVRVPHWQSLPLSKAAQAVQHSAFPDAYGGWEPRATALAAALTGRTLGQLDCTLAHPGVAAATARTVEPGAHILPADATVAAATSTVRSALLSDLGAGLTVTPGAATSTSAQLAVRASGPLPPPGGVAPQESDAAHRAATIANWALAHAAYLGITKVQVADRLWTADVGWHRDRTWAAGGSASGVDGSPVVVLTVAS